eukprot:CCRYP_015956-RA/>CCRYP_015956-RA protein AED:0.07 eAED:0.07 QI:35/1/1/1/0.8/0.45/11/3128/111
MKLKLLYLAATLSSWTAATRSTNDTISDAIISSAVYEEYRVHDIDLAKLGYLKDTHVMAAHPVRKTMEAYAIHKIVSAALVRIHESSLTSVMPYNLSPPACSHLRLTLTSP